MVDALQAELAELVCRLTGAEQLRFTTSGSLSTMYAVLMARSFTGRGIVMKAGGGWHGAQPMLLKGVAYRDGGVGFDGVDSKGLPSSLTDRIVVTNYNDPQRLADDFAEVGDDLACLILEPMLGAGGTIAATTEYLRLARELCTKHGALLILDEMITGFRFHPGGLGALHGVTPDLAIYGKALGGGMPVAAVAGRAEVMAEAGRATGPRVAFSGGTYSAHPSSMLAAKVFLEHLEDHADEIYPRLGEIGAAMRRGFESAFAEAGILARCTGAVDEVGLRQLHGHGAFPPRRIRRPRHTRRRSSIPSDATSSCGRRCSASRCWWRMSTCCSPTAPPRLPTPRTMWRSLPTLAGRQRSASPNTGETEVSQ